MAIERGRVKIESNAKHEELSFLGMLWVTTLCGTAVVAFWFVVSVVGHMFGFGNDQPRPGAPSWPYYFVVENHAQGGAAAMPLVISGGSYDLAFCDALSDLPNRKELEPSVFVNFSTGDVSGNWDHANSVVIMGDIKVSMGPLDQLDRLMSHFESVGGKVVRANFQYRQQNKMLEDSVRSKTVSLPKPDAALAQAQVPEMENSDLSRRLTIVRQGFNHRRFNERVTLVFVGTAGQWNLPATKEASYHDLKILEFGDEVGFDSTGRVNQERLKHAQEGRSKGTSPIVDDLFQKPKPHPGR